MIRENYRFSSTVEEAAVDALKKMSEYTKLKHTSYMDCAILSKMKIEDKEDGTISVSVKIITPTLIHSMNQPEAMGKIQVGTISFPAEWRKEVEQSPFLMTIKDEDGNARKFLVSESSLNTLRLRCKHGLSIESDSFIRDCFIAEHLFSLIKGNILYREMEENGKIVRKVMSFFSDKYKKIDQTILLEIAEKVGGTMFKSATIDRDFTRCVYTVPEWKDVMAEELSRTDITPILELKTSDTGYCSVTAQGGFLVNGRKVIITDYTAKHWTYSQEKAIVDGVHGTVVPAMVTFADDIVALMSVSLTYEDIKKLLKKMTNIYKMIGQKNATKLRQLILSSLDITKTYTGFYIYDQLLMVQNQPWLFNADARTKEMFEKDASSIPRMILKSVKTTTAV